MFQALKERLHSLALRYEELERRLFDPEIIQNLALYQSLVKERSELTSLVKDFTQYQDIERGLAELESFRQEADPEFSRWISEEKLRLEAAQDTLIEALKIHLLPKDLHDERSVFLEVRAGTGGDEAALFAGNLWRMYSRYADQMGWGVELLRMNPSEQGGFKEIIARIDGPQVYAQLKFESGTHRVQRVPSTETQGRIHTSTCTVAVLPEADAIEMKTLNPSELRIDTYRASGAGGQHVNKTESAIRITHLPSGLVVECQDERSQHKNKARALSLLQSKLMQQEQESQRRDQEQQRRSLVGSGDRSERIRTYNFPQGRLTDHRIQLTLYQLESILEGQIQCLIDPLLQHEQALKLAQLADDSVH